MGNPRKYHLTLVHRIFRYIRGTIDRELFYPSLLPCCFKLMLTPIGLVILIHATLLLAGVCLLILSHVSAKNKLRFQNHWAAEAKYRSMMSAS